MVRPVEGDAGNRPVDFGQKLHKDSPRKRGRFFEKKLSKKLL